MVAAPRPCHREETNQYSSDDPFSKYLTYRFIEPDPFSDDVWRQIHSWIRNCDTSHPQCCPAVGEPATWRLRLLEISQDGDTMKLVEKDATTTPYITLSHCWGSAKTLTTTRANLEAHKVGISGSNLPQTFKDVITVARKLGIGYLWIDSLCIIQGDVEDWEAVGSKMDLVYSFAYLTIAATRASGDDEGFLQHRSPRPALGHEEDVYLEYPRGFHRILLNSGRQSLGTVYFSPHNTLRAGSEPISKQNNPLLFRAWTLQERYLSKRTLSFLRYQIMFECEVSRCYEGGQTVTDAAAGYSVERLLPTDVPNLEGLLPPGSLPTRSYDRWYEMISAYSLRNLTFANDKLPALSGLASRLFKQTGSKYHAGIWEEDFFTGLLWYTPLPNQCTRHPWRAPSWSWASVDGTLRFPIDEAETSLDMFSHTLGSILLPSVCIHSVSVKSADIDTFGQALGQVKGGILDIEAVMMPVNGPKRFPMDDALCLDLSTTFFFDGDRSSQAEEDQAKLWASYPEAYMWLPTRLAVFIKETNTARVFKAKSAKGWDVNSTWQNIEQSMYCGIVIEVVQSAHQGQEETWKRIGVFTTRESDGKSSFDIGKRERRRVRII